MTATYDLLASSIIGSTVSSVTLSSIPSTYRDLILVVTKPSGDYRVSLRFNGDSSASYRIVSMQGYGTGTVSYQSATQTYVWAPLFNSGGNSPNLTIFQIMDYAQTDKQKSVLSRTNISPNFVTAEVSRWDNNSAINSIYIEPDLTTGTTIYLYGVVA